MACAEDRSMGLELQLIELVRLRDLAAAHGDPAVDVEREIAEITDLLADL